MSLNIKSEEAHRLAKRLAKRTGESMTTVVVNALKTQLARVESEESVEELMRIARRCAKHLREGPGPTMTIEDLYDEETGLPK
jgi:antitoxin VapB